MSPYEFGVWPNGSETLAKQGDTTRPLRSKDFHWEPFCASQSQVLNLKAHSTSCFATRLHPRAQRFPIKLELKLKNRLLTFELLFEHFFRLRTQTGGRGLPCERYVYFRLRMQTFCSFELLCRTADPWPSAKPKALARRASLDLAFRLLSAFHYCSRFGLRDSNSHVT